MAGDHRHRRSKPPHPSDVRSDRSRSSAGGPHGDGYALRRRPEAGPVPLPLADRARRALPERRPSGEGFAAASSGSRARPTRSLATRSRCDSRRARGAARGGGLDRRAAHAEATKDRDQGQSAAPPGAPRPRSPRASQETSPEIRRAPRWRAVDAQGGLSGYAGLALRAEPDRLSPNPDAGDWSRAAGAKRGRGPRDPGSPDRGRGLSPIGVERAALRGAALRGAALRRAALRRAALRRRSFGLARSQRHAFRPTSFERRPALGGSALQHSERRVAFPGGATRRGSVRRATLAWTPGRSTALGPAAVVSAAVGSAAVGPAAIRDRPWRPAGSFVPPRSTALRRLAPSGGIASTTWAPSGTPSLARRALSLTKPARRATGLRHVRSQCPDASNPPLR